MKLIRTALVISILFIGGISLLSWWGLPKIVEKHVVRLFEEKGYRVKDLPVNKVGLRRARISAGGLEYQGHSLDWDSIQIDYKADALLRREIDRFEISEPVLSLNFVAPEQPGIPHTPIASIELTVEEGAEIPQPVERASAETIGAAEEALDDGKASEPAAILSDESLKPEGSSSLWDSSKIFKFIRNFPVSEVLARNGQAKVLVPGDHLLQTGWSSQILKTDDLMTGELTSSGDGFSSEISLNAMESARFFSARAEAKIDLSGSERFLSEFFEEGLGLEGLSSMVLPEDLSIEMLAETVPGNLLAASGQAFMENMRLDIPEKETYLRIGSIHLAGTAGQSHAILSAGIRLEDSIIYGTASSPFGLALKLDQSGLLTAESEEIRHRYKDWSAVTAVRGRARMDPSGYFKDGRLEWAFRGVEGTLLEIESFSALIEFQMDNFHVTLSPLGLRRNGTLWLEEAEVYWDLMTQTGNGSLDWYGTSGAFAGSIRGSVSMESPNASMVSMELFDKARNSVMEIHYKSEDILSLEIAGGLPVEWINSVGNWWGGLLPGRVHGSAPEIYLSLQGESPFLKGEVKVVLQDFGFTSDGGAVLKGIQAQGDFLVNMLPKTTEPQAVQIDSIQLGSIRIENLQGEWNLPVIHRLQVNKLEGDLGNGDIWMSPFSFNPLNPILETELFFTGIAADQVLSWLKEERFSMDGTLSGSLKVGWRDGEMLLGNGQFRIDSAVAGNRFRFLDEEFVDQYFSSLGSVPAELRERFRQALLQEGIKLDELEVTFQSAEESGMVSLRILLSGESKTELLEIPIKGIVINNLISEEDLGHLLGLLGPVRMMSNP